MQIIHSSPNPVHLHKVKSHAGIAGTECADAVAKYQATQVDANLADTGILCAGIDGNPFHNITWLAYERYIPSNATSSRTTTYLPQSSFISQISIILWSPICTPNIKLATQILQPTTFHITKHIP